MKKRVISLLLTICVLCSTLMFANVNTEALDSSDGIKVTMRGVYPAIIGEIESTLAYMGDYLHGNEEKEFESRFEVIIDNGLYFDGHWEPGVTVLYEGKRLFPEIYSDMYLAEYTGDDTDKLNLDIVFDYVYFEDNDINGLSIWIDIPVSPCGYRKPISSVELANEKVAYTGNEICFNNYYGNTDIKVYDADGEELYGSGSSDSINELSDYVILYENNINPGIATAKIIGVNDYYGCIEKTFEIADYSNGFQYGSGEVVLANKDGSKVYIPLNSTVTLRTGYDMEEESSAYLVSYTNSEYVNLDSTGSMEYTFTEPGTYIFHGTHEYLTEGFAGMMWDPVDQCFRYTIISGDLESESYELEIIVPGETKSTQSIVADPPVYAGLRDIYLSVSPDSTDANCYVENVEWKSSDTDVAVVENGKVTVKSAGKTTITANAGGNDVVFDLDFEKIDLEKTAFLRYNKVKKELDVYVKGEKLIKNVDYLLEETVNRENDITFKLTGINMFTGSLEISLVDGNWIIQKEVTEEPTEPPTEPPIEEPTEPEPVSPETIYFEVPDNWGNYKGIYCYVSEYDGEHLMNWMSKPSRCEKVSDGSDSLYSYDLSKVGGLQEDKAYYVIFSADNGLQTYETLISPECYGDTLYCDGTTFEHPDNENSKTAIAAYWKAKDKEAYGPIKEVTYKGEVVGSCLVPGRSGQDILADFISSDKLNNTRINSGKIDQWIIDDIGVALGLTKDQVEETILASGVRTDWSKAESVCAGSGDVTEPVETTRTEPTQTTVTEPVLPVITYLVGDANMDGKINVKDATQIQKAVAGLVTLNTTQTIAADSDVNGKLNVKDATAIQKFVAGIPVDAPVGEEKEK